MSDEPVAYRAPNVPSHPAPRGLVLAWCLWLLGSWAVLWVRSLLVGASVPEVQWMIFSCLLGMTLLWPAIRLSDDRFGRWWSVPVEDPRAMRPEWDTIIDWLSLNLIFQTVVWPLKVSARWSVEQTLWLDASVAAWSLLAGLIVGLGCRSRRSGHRSAAMALIVIVMLGEPLALAAVNLFAARPVVWNMRISPFPTIWNMTAPPVDWRPQPAASHAVAVALAAGLGWAILGAGAVIRRVRRYDPTGLDSAG